jgi:lipopolysaccharide export system protein LptA
LPLSRRLLAAALAFSLPVLALTGQAPAQSDAASAEIQFGEGGRTSGQPVEVTADSLQMNRDAGTALFRGNVLIVQGPLRLSGAEVDVLYGPGAEGETQIQRVEARGGVTLVNGPDAAEGEQAVYTVGSGEVVMTGDVLLTRPDAAMTGERLRVNVDDGTGVMEGGVTVLFTPEGGAEDGG